MKPAILLVIGTIAAAALAFTLGFLGASAVIPTEAPFVAAVPIAVILAAGFVRVRQASRQVTAPASES